MKRLFVCFIVILLFRALYSVSPTNSEKLLFETVSANGSNINSEVYEICQDPYGYMWLGTDYGLLRYDGYRTIRVETGEHENSMLLGTSGIEALSPGNDTSLWIGSNNGVFNLSLKSWEIRRPAQFRNQTVRAILFQSDSIVWIGTAQGLYKYNPHSDESIIYNHVNSNLSQNIILALYLDQSGNLWVGTEDKLNILYTGRDDFESFDLKGTYKPDIKHNLVLDIQPYADGNDSILFIGTETGLVLFNRFTNEYTTFNTRNSDLANEVVKTIYARNPQEIFFGTDLGFNKLNTLTGYIERYFHSLYNQHSIVNNQIWDILPDNRGNLWLATSNGISRLSLSPEFFEYFPAYSGDTDPLGTRVADILYDLNNRYWIATSNGLLTSIQGSDGKKTLSNAIGEKSLSIDNINAIAKDDFERIWIGSVAGINIWDQAEERIFIPTVDYGGGTRVSANYISNIIKGYGNDFWIGTWGGGLYKADAGIEELEEIEIDFVADINGQLVKGKENLWTLFGNSLHKFSLNTERVAALEGVDRNSDSTLFSTLCYSKKECLWIGSKNQLFRYDIPNGSLKSVQMPIDEDFIVSGLIEDDDGIIWGCSNNAIFRFDPSIEVFNYFHIPGYIPLNKLLFSPFRKTHEGDLLVCGYDGFLKYSPKDFNLVREASTVRITSVEVNGELLFPGKKLSGNVVVDELISNGSRLILPHKSSNIKLRYSSFAYGETGKEQFACLLEGLETDWRLNEAGSNSIDYINLTPGNYRFLVKSLSGDANEPISHLDIRIKFPFWASPPILVTYIILLLLILGIIISLYKNRLKILMQMNQVKNEKVQIEFQNASKIRFYINISHELLTSISLIIDPVKSILSRKEIKDDTRKTLKLVERNAQFLKVYINQLLNFRKIEIGQESGFQNEKLELVSFCKEIIESFMGKALSKGVTLKLKADVKSLTIDTDEEKLYSIIQNLISNAINFTHQGGAVALSIKLGSQNEITIEVKDNGIGISAEDQQHVFDRFYKAGNNDTSRGMGIGLTIVKDFVEIMNGQIDLQSEIGVGTKVRITLPSQNKFSSKGEEERYIKEYVSEESISKARNISGDHIASSSELHVVLLVDEERDLFEYVLSSLMNRYTVIWAPNGREALEIITKSAPKIIISEIQLPDMDGIDLCRKIRKNAKTSRIPVILLTSKIEVENRVKAIEAGADIFLAKPFEIEVLEANIANLIRNIENTDAFINRSLLLNAQDVEVDSKDDKLLKEVVEYIHKNMDNSQIQAKDISYALGVSHSNLYRRIKNITGQSLNEFIRFVRLQKAEQLLGSGKLSVSEVMYQVGFTNHSYFAKCFKQLYKVTPKNYAKKK